jgi:hypothetical protein
LRKQTHKHLWKNQPEIGNFHYKNRTIKEITFFVLRFLAKLC